MGAVSADGHGMDRNEDDAHADWSPEDVAWDGLTLTAQNSAGTDPAVPSIDKYYIKGRGAPSSGNSGGSVVSTCRVPGCTSDLSRDLKYFRKYRICREHLKSPVLVVEGIPSRFCQQCSRFHHVKEFDGPQRTCRAMLERLRLKRNNKTQADARSGSQGKDTRPVNGSRREDSSSPSNSSGKDAGPHRDLETGQKPSPFRRDPTDSGEGMEFAAAGGAAVSRRSAATSAATAFSLPGSGPGPGHHQYRSHQDQLLLHQQQQQQQAHVQYRSRQAALSPSPGELHEPPVSGPAAGGAAMGAPRGCLVDRQELLRLLLSQNAGLLPSRRNPLAAGSGGPAAHLGGRGSGGAAASGRDVRMADIDSDLLQDGCGPADMAPLYRDSPYGLPPAMAGGDRMQMGMRGVAHVPPRPQEAAHAEYLYRRSVAMAAQEHPLHRQGDYRGQHHMELAGGGALDDSMLLQPASSRGYAHSHRDAGVGAGVGGPSGRVLDLNTGQPPAPVGPMLNLGSRADLSLELELQDICREEPPRLRLVWRLGTL